MTFEAIDTWWWRLLFLTVAGAIATDSWRFLGVAFSGRIKDQSEILVLVRTIATALVAAVIGNLIVFPSGTLAATSLLLRVGAAAAGFVAYLLVGKKMLVGILAGEAVLCIGLLLGI